jgi:hypothetical protein
MKKLEKSEVMHSFIYFIAIKLNYTYNKKKPWKSTLTVMTRYLS